MTSQRKNLGFQPMPARISVVVQVPRFEAWLTADPVALANSELIQPGFTPHTYADVDTQISNHRDYLMLALRRGFRKRPAEIARISKLLRPTEMARHSRSFQKFWKEVTKAYARR
jgi:hypothetical protein